MIKSSLICITSSFPYGRKETYFHNELEYLSKSFENIFIIPIYNPYGSTNIRDTPENVVVLEPILALNKYSRLISFLLLFNIFNPVFIEFFTHKVFFSKFRFNRWVNSLILYGLGRKRLSEILKDINSGNVILYSYWAECPFFISSIFRGYKKVVRMHGADFYVERNKGYLPVRYKIYDSCDLLLPISKNIQNILIKRYDQKPSKIKLSYLGVCNITSSSTLDICRNEVIRIISCSNVVKLKRVHLIYEILLKISSYHKVEWHHIGGGEQLDFVKNFVFERKKSNIDVFFYGETAQRELLEIYRNNFFHWFINTSEYEGLPVSIMEAFSFGIPAIATDVGGTREIVKPYNSGYLINNNTFNVEQIATCLVNISSPDYYNMRINAYETWEKGFNSKVNYEKLVAELMSILCTAKS